MNRKAIVIASALLALSAVFGVRRALRKGQVVPPPSAVETKANAHDPVTSSEAVETSGDVPGTAPSAKTDGIPARPLETATSPEAEARMRPQPRLIHEAIEASYTSTVAAFALHGEEADYEAHDAQAQADVDRLQELFSSMRAELSPELTSSCEAMIARIAAAQLQLMAFAINRKNRGLPDSSQAEAEFADLQAFQEDSAPLLERWKVSLSSGGANMSCTD